MVNRMARECVGVVWKGLLSSMEGLGISIESAGEISGWGSWHTSSRSIRILGVMYRTSNAVCSLIKWNALLRDIH